MYSQIILVIVTWSDSEEPFLKIQSDKQYYYFEKETEKEQKVKNKFISKLLVNNFIQLLL